MGLSPFPEANVNTFFSNMPADAFRITEAERQYCIKVLNEYLDSPRFKSLGIPLDLIYPVEGQTYYALQATVSKPNIS